MNKGILLLLTLLKQRLEGYRPNLKFRLIWSTLSKNNNFIDTPSSKEMLNKCLNNFQPRCCTLTVTEANRIFTAYLLPPQVHFDIHNTINDIKIYWGYLTSQEVSTNIFLSKFQVFNDNEKANEPPQFLNIVEYPIRVPNQALQHLNKITIDRSNKCFYNDVFDKLKETFKPRIVPKLEANNIAMYNDIGVTIDKHSIIQKIKLRKHMLFPSKGQYVDRVAWDKMIKVIIKSLPQDIANTVEENYNRVKLLEL